MTEIKVTFSMLVPGATMLSQDYCENNQMEGYDVNKLHLSYLDKGKKKFKDITFMTRKCIPAKQVINITKDSYNYMVSNDGYTITKFNPKHWKQLPRKIRLEEHLKLIAENFNAISYSYQILED